MEGCLAILLRLLANGVPPSMTTDSQSWNQESKGESPPRPLSDKHQLLTMPTKMFPATLSDSVGAVPMVICSSQAICRKQPETVSQSIREHTGPQELAKRWRLLLLLAH